jgi:hypothetical protein
VVSLISGEEEMPTRKRTGTTKKSRAGSRAASGGRAKKAGTAARAGGTRKKTAGKSTAARGGRAKAGKSARGGTKRQPRTRTVAASEPEVLELVEIDVIAVEPPASATGILLMPEEDLEEELLEELDSERRESQYGQVGAQPSEEDEDSEAGLPE